MGAAVPASSRSRTGPGHVSVALVRGINVGTSTLVPMPEFRALFERLGYTEVVTLLRSGNVVFASSGAVSAADVTEIEAEFTRTFGFSAGFVILPAADFLRITDANPLLEVGTDLSKVTITYLPLTPDARAALISPTFVLPDPAGLLPEVLQLGAEAVYAWSPLGISNTRIPVSFWRQFGPVYTARNVNTANKLAALVRARL